jgi:hypothetical protein
LLLIYTCIPVISVVYVATSLATAKGYLPVKAVGLA